MNKLVILFVIIGCGLALHAQRYPPSTPGGNYQQGNGTQPTSNYGSGQVTPLVNGQVYRYTGPFTLACWLPNNTNAPYRYDTCRSQYQCATLINDYRNCQGTVKKYPPVA